MFWPPVPKQVSGLTSSIVTHFCSRIAHTRYSDSRGWGPTLISPEKRQCRVQFCSYALDHLFSRLRSCPETPSLQTLAAAAMHLAIARRVEGNNRPSDRSKNIPNSYSSCPTHPQKAWRRAGCFWTELNPRLVNCCGPNQNWLSAGEPASRKCTATCTSLNTADGGRAQKAVTGRHPTDRSITSASVSSGRDRGGNWTGKKPCGAGYGPVLLGWETLSACHFPLLACFRLSQHPCALEQEVHT